MKIADPVRGKILFVIFLGFMAGACQKASNVVIDTSPLIDAQLTYFDKDSDNDNIDVLPYLGTQKSLKISDSFQVSLSSTADLYDLAVVVQNDSGNVLAQVSFSKVSGNLIGGKFSYTPAPVYVGNLTYTFTAYNRDGAPGNYATKIVRLLNSSNNPPVLDTVIAADSVKIDTTKTTFVYFYAKVHDPFGLDDIAAVEFNTTLPDGSSSSHNPFYMFDDGGASGDPTDADKVAHDGTFTYEGQLPPNQPVGTYTFTFFAVNRSGIASDSIAHKIKVYQ